MVISGGLELVICEREEHVSELSVKKCAFKMH